MFKSLFAIAAVAAAFVAAPVLANDYVPLDFEEDYSSVTVLDYGSIAADGPYKAAWVIVMDHGDKIEDGVVKARIRWLFDCGKQQSAIRQLQLFDDATKPPANDWPLTDAELKWQPRQPDTIGATAIDYVCGVKTPTADDMFTVDNEDQLFELSVGMYEQKKTAK